jgi:sugar transferase (PEP-CTERM/EpsH1 system associated)
MRHESPPLIAHVIYRLDFGGLENGLVNLINHIPVDRYRHAVVCLAGWNPEFRCRIRRNDVEVVSIDKKPGKDFGAYVRMWRVIRRLGPAIVHTRNLGTVDMQWMAAAALTPGRVHGEHGWDSSDPQGLASKDLVIRRLCRPVIQRYVPMSADIARWLERDVRIPATRIRQLYSGVDVRKFHPRERAPQTDVATGPPEDSVLTIGTIGRLDPVKNHRALLDAFASLRGQFPRLRLIVVGDGPLRSELEAQAATLGISDDVRFTGSRSDTPQLLQKFDIFVLPSVNEGISNTIMEAMATGLPVVAARVGGNPELIADGVSGCLYSASEAGAIQHAIVPYLTNSSLRAAHGKAARDRVVQNFSLEAMVQRYLDLYDELTKKTQSARTAPALARSSVRGPGEGS